VTGITVQKDGVLFRLYSDPYNDIRYYGNLKIPFPNKKEVPSADVASQVVAEVLTVVPQDDQGNQQQQEPAPPPPPPSQRPVQVQRPVPPQRPGQPLPPAQGSNGYVAPQSLAPPTIALGQTKEQVAAAFGPPLRTAVIGAKEIFFYRNMKVTFTSGRVSNVE
jgi:hypothetical protein